MLGQEVGEGARLFVLCICVDKALSHLALSVWTGHCHPHKGHSVYMGMMVWLPLVYRCGNRLGKLLDQDHLAQWETFVLVSILLTLCPSLVMVIPLPPIVVVIIFSQSFTHVWFHQSWANIFIY